MTLLKQITEACFYAPRSLLQLKSNSLMWLGIYFISAFAVFSLFTSLLITHQEAIKNILLDYFFPQSWHGISQKLANFFFESQAKIVIGNMIISGSLVLASIFLFPIKEKYSAEFEKDAKYPNGPVKEFPLSYQAWEEIKLFLFYLTAQSVILWIGYYPYPWTNGLSIGLSYLFLFFTFGLDFISPTLQRHRTHYTIILKVLLKKPVLVLLFGLLFSLPSILLSRYIFTIETLNLFEIISILFLANVILLTLAIPAGTHVASSLLPQVKQTIPPTQRSIKYTYSAMSLILLAGLFLHGKLITSLHHKSQLLKAEYHLDWSSIDYQLPSLSEFLNSPSVSNLSFDMVITNPTGFDIIIEKSQIFVSKQANTIATIDLTGFEVPAGESRQVNMQLNSNSNLAKISNFRTLLENWRVDMHLELMPGIPFVLNIVE